MQSTNIKQRQAAASQPPVRVTFLSKPFVPKVEEIPRDICRESLIFLCNSINGCGNLQSAQRPTIAQLHLQTVATNRHRNQETKTVTETLFYLGLQGLS